MVDNTLYTITKFNWRSQLKYIKDRYKISNQPRGVAVREGSVYLMYSNHWKLRTPSYSSRIFNENLIDYWKPTKSPQRWALTQHSLNNIKMHTMMSAPFHHTLPAQ